VTSPENPAERFNDLVAALLAESGDVEAPGAAGAKGFGSGALKAKGKIFAMVSQGRLVVKLPAKRVTALVEAGEGVNYDAGKGRPMKEWLALSPDSGLDWLALSREAMEFVTT
jgi:TfoX/Sxy family transcriptional regulator of competence genes